MLIADYYTGNIIFHSPFIPEGTPREKYMHVN